MENQSPHLSLRVPTPTQQNLSFCDATPKDIKYWLAHLPKANLGETARQLYQGLIELNQLVLPVEARLQLLELFRPEVHFVCAHLERHFLNQAIVLDERPRKIANLCQALQNHLAIGYKLIVVQEAPRNSRDRAQLLAVGIQRAIRSLCGPLIRASQLYCPVPEGLWLELHQLYQLASQRGVHRLAVRDELAKHTPGLSVEQAYLIPLLLGCARCNQMRQNNIARLAEVLEPWSQLLSIQSAALPGSLFIAVPQIDGPPRYRSLYPETQLANALGIDTQPLVELIREYLLQPEAERAKARLPLIEGVTLDLLQHLSSAWGDIAERTFQRTQAHAQTDATEDYPTYALPIVNHSPGGYCLSWPKEVPAQLQAGELVGLQDLPGQAWSIAVVRWIRQVRNGGTQMGIEMIAPAAQPCGLQLLRKTEQSSHYLRALLLPEIAAISRPATVITPRLPFQEGSRVQINLHGEERRAVLNRRQASTGSFSQFEYRSAEPVNTPSDKPVTAPVARPPAGEEDFDSLWKSL
ncbi:molecular chaperone [Pseudomonas aeruginosa]|nr:molecular chaperone [Pseudomonas aeruginosa]EKU2256677.1 molecular chaperone [Pseudomonas aeruginosa]EKU7765982.1 molecular chaperone [Pseudomonas aeruginosa]EKU7813498.1 molecular chaperone [Pseudomonas aeruginosa]EKW0511113.1 molecular chaperone [Pseudomonas aeruginosa]